VCKRLVAVSAWLAVASSTVYLHFGPFSKYVADRIRQDIHREALHPTPIALRRRRTTTVSA
jgi:CHAD domain-containing protein